MKVMHSFLLLLIMLFSSIQIQSQYKIGVEFERGYFKYVVDKIEFKKVVTNGLNSSTANGIYLIVHMTVTNIDKEKSTLTNSMFKVYDSDDYKFETSINAIIAMILNDPNKIFMLKELPPKIPTPIIMPFEVPTQNATYTLEVSGGFGTGVKGLVDLEKADNGRK